LLLGALGLGCREAPPVTPEPVGEPAVEPTPRSPEAELDAFAHAVRAAVAGERVELGSLPPILLAPSMPVYVNLRADGESMDAIWLVPDDSSGPMNWHLLEGAIARLTAKLGPEATARVTSVEINLSGEPTAYTMQQWPEFVDVDAHELPRQFGILGDAVVVDDAHVIVRPPTQAITSNQTLQDHMKRLHEQWQLTGAEWQAAAYVRFPATQMLVTLEPLAAKPMFRGNEVVELAEVDPASTEQLAALAAQWLIANLDEHGRLAHGYRPSKHGALNDPNAIRQWDSSNALLRWAEHREDPAVFELVARNIEHNLQSTFRFDKQFGVIGFDTESERRGKLGAMAVAARALHHHPERARWTKQLTALRASIDHLAHPDGHFDSFYDGTDEPKYWLFYPGEALLHWAETYAEQPSPELLQKYRRSFEFYRAWHRQPENGKPALAPWHMLANAALLDALAGTEPELEAELRSFVFELADLLVSMQQWEGDPAHPDEWGRFYAPDRPWGEEHATSTGIYAWSLVAAFRLARAAGDSTRAERYRIAILRALRSLMQLQFVDEVDMFYVPHAERVHVAGGIRTTVFDNQIRVDNVGYALLTALAVLETFGERDYASELSAAETRPAAH
jgi:hypothetical protein